MRASISRIGSPPGGSHCNQRGSQLAPQLKLRRTGPQGGPFLDPALSPSHLTGAQARLIYN
jgi:hypothetical protein